MKELILLLLIMIFFKDTIQKEFFSKISPCQQCYMGEVAKARKSKQKKDQNKFLTTCKNKGKCDPGQICDFCFKGFAEGIKKHKKNVDKAKECTVSFKGGRSEKKNWGDCRYGKLRWYKNKLHEYKCLPCVKEKKKKHEDDGNDVVDLNTDIRQCKKFYNQCGAKKVNGKGKCLPEHRDKNCVPKTQASLVKAKSHSYDLNN